MRKSQNQKSWECAVEGEMVHGIEKAKKVVEALMNATVRFEVEPCPGDMWTINVRRSQLCFLKTVIERVN